MNIGVSGIKADSRVMAFVEHAIGRPLSTKATAQIVKDAYQQSGLEGVSLLQVDHAIWLHQRNAEK